MWHGARVTEFLKAIGWAMVPMAILLPLCIGVEMAWPRTRYSLRERLPGACYVIIVPALIAALSWPLHQAWTMLGFGSPVDVSGLPVVAKFMLLFLLFDFLRYWEHRFEHRFWWPVHAVHHAQDELHAANSYAHPLQAMPEILIVTIPVSLIETGGPIVPNILWTLFAFQNLVIHSPLRLHAGQWRMLYIDSHFHRIHHSVEERHWHHNFGFVLPFWDHLFGTSHAIDEREWPATGVPGVPSSLDARTLLVQPFRDWARRHKRASAEQWDSALE